MSAALARSFLAAPARIVSLALAERDRWFLWTPVLLGFGIAVYFGLRAEPPAALGASGTGSPRPSGSSAPAAVAMIGRAGSSSSPLRRWRLPPASPPRSCAPMSSPHLPSTVASGR